MAITTTREQRRMENRERALAAYMEHHDAILALLERITNAVAGHDVPGADPEHVNWATSDRSSTWRHEVQGIADQMFNEGEYAG